MKLNSEYYAKFLAIFHPHYHAPVGLWGFFSKMATQSLRDVDAAIYQAIGYVLVMGVAIFFIRFQGGGKPIGILYAVLSGVPVALATFFFFSAITRGCSVVVVSMTALYPLVTL